jgi:DNA-binding transcriptional regulator YhcF (GntR family)
MANPLVVNLDINSKTVDKALDLISQAGFVLYEPTKIRKKAKAEADALVIRTEGEIKASKLQKQAIYRLAKLEIVRQKNINVLTEKAMQEINNSGKTIDSATDTDWIRKFFDFSQDVSNEEMQDIWAKVLAGEFIKSKSFSYKTMSILANMRQVDAELFSKLCRYVIVMYGGRKVSLIFPDGSDGKYNKGEFTFEDLQHLESLGLIHFNSISSFRLTLSSAKTIIFSSDNKSYAITTEEEKIDLGVGDVLLTREGQELFSVINAKAVESLVDLVKQKWVTGSRTMMELK